MKPLTLCAEQPATEMHPQQKLLFPSTVNWPIKLLVLCRTCSPCKRLPPHPTPAAATAASSASFSSSSSSSSSFPFSSFSPSVSVSAYPPSSPLPFHLLLFTCLSLGLSMSLHIHIHISARIHISILVLSLPPSLAPSIISTIVAWLGSSVLQHPVYSHLRLDKRSLSS